MGCGASKTAVAADTRAATADDDDFNEEQWQAMHNQTDETETRTKLWSHGTDLLSKEVEGFDADVKKALLICCNTYTTPGYELGVGPMNDAIHVAERFESLGYDVFFMHNPKSTDFVPWLGWFFEHAQQSLLVYYTGHGASVKDDDGDEADGMDEALVFDDKGFVRDDELLTCAQDRKTNDDLHVVLLSDCCHSGSIWDLQSEKRKNLPPNMISLSAARDSQTAKQTSIGGADQGIFTHYFLKFLAAEPEITAKDMRGKINGFISKYDQHFTVHATRPKLVNEPIVQ